MPILTMMRNRRPHKTVPLPSALTVLTRQKEPITRVMKTQFEKMIDAAAALLVHDIAAQDRRAHAEAVARAEQVTQELDETTTACNAAQEEYQAARTSP